MSKFLMTSKKSKEAVKNATTKGGYARMKIPEDGSKARMLILGPVSDERSVVFVATKHERWANGKPMGRTASPSFTGEPDKIANLGWKLKDKYGESKNKKKKEIFREFLPKRPHYVNVIDLKDEETIAEGPKVYEMSGKVAEVVLDELKDVGEDLTTVCDFDEGRILLVQTNGEKKLKKRYKAKFSNKTANLIEDGKLDDEAIGEIAEKLFDLETLQPSFNEEEFDKYFESLKKFAKGLDVDIDDVTIDEETEELAEEEADDDDGFEDEDIDTSDDDDKDGGDEDDDPDFDDEDEDDKSKKNKKKDKETDKKKKRKRKK